MGKFSEIFFKNKKNCLFGSWGRSLHLFQATNRHLRYQIKGFNSLVRSSHTNCIWPCTKTFFTPSISRLQGHILFSWGTRPLRLSWSPPPWSRRSYLPNIDLISFNRIRNDLISKTWFGISSVGTISHTNCLTLVPRRPLFCRFDLSPSPGGHIIIFLDNSLVYAVFPPWSLLGRMNTIMNGILREPGLNLTKGFSRRKIPKLSKALSTCICQVLIFIILV